MNGKLGPDDVRAFWTRQAIEHGLSPSASWSDHRVIELEVAELLSRLSDGDRVLDVGCANGYSTVQYATERRIDIKGVDYIPEMIAEARRRLASLPTPLAGSVCFEEGDILSLREPSGTFDKLVVVRVLINLAGPEEQRAALRECARVLKPGGRLLLSEATLQGWRRLNSLRAEWQLDPVPMPAFNQYVDEDELRRGTDDLELVEVVNFASTYYVGTRLLKPLLAKVLGGAIDVANPDMEWNRWFAQLPQAGDYGTQKLFVFRKTGPGTPRP